MMRLKEGELKVFESIDLYNRYLSITNQHRFREGLDLLEKLDKQTILNILYDVFKVKSKYFTKEKFYQIKIEKDQIESIYNICLQYGSIESIFWIKSSHGNIGYGNEMVTMLRLMDKERNIETSSSDIGQPCFKTYEELRDILEKLKPLFDDFTEGFIKSGLLT